MREFQEKRKIQRRVYSKTTLLVLFIITILVARGAIGVYSKEHASRQEVERLTKQKEDLEVRLAAVSKNNEVLKTPEGVEAEIRTKFDVVKPGEGVIVVVDEEIPMPEEEKKGFIRKFWDSVTGVFKKDADEQKDGETKGTDTDNEKPSQSGNSEAGGEGRGEGQEEDAQGGSSE